MTEEELIAKKHFAGAKKGMQKRRDDYHDYTERRIYMITLEVEGRRPVFGRLVGDISAPLDSADGPHIELSELGEAVQSEWMGIHGYYPQIEILAVQMMPDHMHGILFVKEKLPVHLGQVISGFKAGCRKAEKALAAARSQATVKPQGAAAEPQSAEKGAEEKGAAEKGAEEKGAEEKGAAEKGAVEKGPAEKGAEEKGAAERGAAEKGAAEKGSEEQIGKNLSQQVAALPQQSMSMSQDKRQGMGQSLPQGMGQSLPQGYAPLFSKGYNDLILRSYDELPVWQNYLRDNPRRLMMKRACPERLRPFFGLQIGSRRYSGIGNRALLSATQRLAVRVSRRMTGQELESALLYYLEKARKGIVLVSPCISPGEKLVMRTAFNEGLPMIVIMENGFTPLSKPRGEQFYACYCGRLLMLSAWEHHNEKRKLTAEQCREMNLMALEICE